MDNKNFIVLNDLESWNQYYESDKCLILDFTASWCKPCKIISPVFELLSEKYKDITFIKVDVDDHQDLCAQRNIRCMPTFEFVKNKEIIYSIQGVDIEKLINLSKNFNKLYNENHIENYNEEKTK